ncbi:hypothetical protein [Streptomyces sp. NPDC048266]|uniref:hypothetical protein n=1 Tax=Streptomyces sp. NPDC048266 TaxID=3155787 RepID=UPI00340A493C
MAERRPAAARGGGRRGLLAAGTGRRQDPPSTIAAATIGLETLCGDNGEWPSTGTVTGVWRTLLPMLTGAATLVGLQAAGSSPASGPRAPAPIG